MKALIAKEGDGVGPVTDTHVVINTATGDEEPQPFPFVGSFDMDTLCNKVRVNRMPVATIDSIVRNEPVHVAVVPYEFLLPLPTPTPEFNTAKISSCSAKVRVNGSPVARADDPCETCSEGPSTPAATVKVRNPVKVYIGTLEQDASNANQQ